MYTPKATIRVVCFHQVGSVLNLTSSCFNNEMIVSLLMPCYANSWLCWLFKKERHHRPMHWFARLAEDSVSENVSSRSAMFGIFVLASTTRHSLISDARIERVSSSAAGLEWPWLWPNILPLEIQSPSLACANPNAEAGQSLVPSQISSGQQSMELVVCTPPMRLKSHCWSYKLSWFSALLARRYGG